MDETKESNIVVGTFGKTDSTEKFFRKLESNGILKAKVVVVVYQDDKDGLVCACTPSDNVTLVGMLELAKTVVIHSTPYDKE